MLLRIAIIATLLGRIALGRSLMKPCTKKNILSAPEGSFQTPNYPFWRYPTNVECNYIIKAKKRHFIEITFHSFELEEAYRGKKTDYLEIFDGRENDRRQTVYFYDKLETPFKFYSYTTRVIMRFVSNEEFNFHGFRATYRNIPDTEGCEPSDLHIKDGEVSCPIQGDTGFTSSCEVTCDEGFTLVGDKIVSCEKREFQSPPMCLPSSMCDANLLQVDNSDQECELDAAKETSMCYVTCKENYVLLGNGTVTCEDRMFVSPPSCVPDPEIMTECEANMTLCPYTDREIKNYFSTNGADKDTGVTDDQVLAFLEEFNNTLVPLPGFGRSSGTESEYYACDKYLCRTNSETGLPMITCVIFMQKLSAYLGWDGDTMLKKMIHCMKCQSTNCGEVVVLFP